MSKNKVSTILYIVLTIGFIFTSVQCSRCGVEKVQVLHGLKNYQSIIGYVSNCSATSAESIHVTFVKPGMDLGNEKADVFSAANSMKLKLMKISQDSVKIIFSADEDKIIKKETNLYGVTFIYELNGKYFNKN